MITENISTLKIQKLTKDQFQNGLENNILDDTSIYLTPVEVKDYALKSDLNTKADLIDNKIPEEQMPDIYLPKEMAGSPNGVATLDAEGKVSAEQIPDDIVDLSDYYTKTEVDKEIDSTKESLNANLAFKADLIDGKVPLSQLPDNIGNGGGNNPIAPGSQIQTDYNQNDDTQIDYIKNRPFYSVPPEYNLNLNLPRTKTTISWDGVIQPNHPKIEFSMDGSLMTYYKVNNDFINSQNILYGYAKYQFLPESLNEFEMEGLKDYQAIFPLSPDTMTNMVFADNNDLFFGTALISSTTAGEVPIDALGISLTIPEPGTYFLSDLEGNLIGPGYLSDIEGEIFIDLTDPDVLNNPNYIIGEDLFGSDTLFFAEKLVDSFIPTEQLVNGTVRLNQVSWDPDNFGEGSASMEVIISEDLFSSEDMIIGDDGVSYVILMESSLPIIASINSLTETFGGMLSVNGPGTYLCYNNLNKDAQGNEFWVDKLITRETVFQIDPKFLPEQEAFIPDYEEMNPSSKSYIANRPYYSKNYYNSYYGDISDTSLRVVPNNDGTVFYQWGYDLNDETFQNPELYNKGDLDIVVKSAYWNNFTDNISNPSYRVTTADRTDKVLYVYTWGGSDTQIYWDTFGFSNSRGILAYIALEDNITTSIETSWDSSNTITVTFPKRGIYYLHSIKDPNNQIYLNSLNLYRERKSIQVQTTDKVEYTNTPISSQGVYQALGYRNSITITDLPSSNWSEDLITAYGLYKGLNDINDYINSYSDNYQTSSLRYRGTSLSRYELSPSENGTISWQYE